MSADLFALKGVTEFKPIFKVETNLAQIIVVVVEKTRTPEGDVLFQITDLINQFYQTNQGISLIPDNQIILIYQFLKIDKILKLWKTKKIKIN